MRNMSFRSCASAKEPALPEPLGISWAARSSPPPSGTLCCTIGLSMWGHPYHERKIMKSPIAIVAVASCLTAACRTASPPPVPASLLACGKMQDPDARVRCYDTQIAAMNRSATPTSAGSGAVPTVPTVPTPAPAAATPAASATAAPAASTAAAATSAAPPASTAAAAPAASAAPAPAPPATPSNRSLVAEFGSEQLPASERPPDPRQKEILSSTISGIQQESPNNFVISLSNGQAWVENDAELTQWLHVGEGVQIERGALGGYHLSTSSIGAKNWVLVTRIR